MRSSNKKPCKRRIIIFSIITAAALIGAMLAYMLPYSHADDDALAALSSDDHVSVMEQSGGGYLFDGPSDERLLIFYPGGKVDEKSYAPLLHSLAREGIDVYLVKMPLHFAFFDINKADDIIADGEYQEYYIGGHSLGGAMAAVFAANNGDKVDGTILLAAYPTKPLNSSMIEISVYGTEDAVLNSSRLEEGRAFAPQHFEELAIRGGNHAQFGNYGEQSGDGTATISADDQQRQTVEFIMKALEP